MFVRFILLLVSLLHVPQAEGYDAVSPSASTEEGHKYRCKHSLTDDDKVKPLGECSATSL